MTDAIVTKYRNQGVILALLIFAVDQAVKYYVSGPLALKTRMQIELVPIFNLTWAENRGVSMGFLTAETDTARWLLVTLTGLIAAVVLAWIWRERARGDIIALAMILGGALGNIVDRARLGYVIDYADLHFGDFRPFLIFNVADAAITLGVLLLLARVLIIGDKSKNKEADDGKNAADDDISGGGKTENDNA